MKTNVQTPVIISVGSRCENRCYFCGIPAHGEEEAAAAVERCLRVPVSEGRLVIQGRDPLGFSGFEALMKCAVRCGFSSIRMETCGLSTLAPRRASRWKETGLNEICVMLPAATEEQYAQITGNPRGFQTCVRFLGAICRVEGLHVSVRIPVCAENAADLPAIIRLAAGHGIRTIILDASETHRFWPAEHRREIFESVRKALACGISLGIEVGLKGAKFHPANVSADGRISKELRGGLCLLTYYRPGRERRREVFSVDFRLTHKCNQNCLFCAAGRTRKEPPAETIKACLKETLKTGVHRICFEGGEPTLFPELPELVYAAKCAGVREITLMTNGVRSADLSFAGHLCAAGVNRVFVSLHAHEAALSDAITRTPGTFDRTVSGIHNFLASGAPTYLIFVMLSKNIEILPRYLKFVRREFGRIPVLLSMVTPYFAPSLEAALIPRYTDLAPVLKRAAAAAARLDIPLSAMEEQHRPPDCVLREVRFLIRNLFAPLEIRETAEGFVKPARCARCATNTLCPGVREFYARAHGLSEIIPLGAENA